MPDVVSFFTTNLRVHRNEGQRTMLYQVCLRFFTNPFECIDVQNPTKCGPTISIPDSYINDGFDADFVAFVSGDPTDEGTVAFASHCQTTGRFYEASNPTPGRPTAGFINFGSQEAPNLDFNDEETRQQWIRTGIHEMAHALGFSKSLYSSYWNAETQDFYEQVTIRTNDRGTLQTKMVLPNVLNWARNHFGCAELDGVEVEDQGGTGTAESHWEMRLYMDEVMKGVDTYPEQYSEVTGLTLSLFKDMGWYQVEMSAARPAKWGKQAGCDFVYGTGVDNGQPTSKYWCTERTQSFSCDVYRRARSICWISQFTSPIAPPSYRYFSDPTVGGTETHADFCPYKRARTVQYPTGFTQTGLCSRTQNRMNPNNWGETYGRGSYCMSSTLLRNDIRGSFFASLGVGCYQVANCNSDDQSYEVTVDGNDGPILCFTGQVQRLSRFNGQLTCPPYEDVC